MYLITNPIKRRIYMRKSIKKLMMVIVLICAVLVVNHPHAFAATDPYLTGYKWTKSNLTYYIDRTPTSSNLSVYIPLLVQAIEGAEFMWNIYLNDYGTGLSFTQVTTQSNADIIIKFGNTGVGVDARVVATETIGNTYKKATMTVKDYNIINYTGNRIVNIFQHEFGHRVKRSW